MIVWHSLNFTLIRFFGVYVGVYVVYVVYVDGNKESRLRRVGWRSGA